MSERILAVHAIGRDRVGRVSEIINAVQTLAGYHDDPRTALLAGGNLAVLVTVRTDASVTEMERAVSHLNSPNLTISVVELKDHTPAQGVVPDGGRAPEEFEDEEGTARRLVLRVHAQGRPGVLAAFAKVVAEHNGHIHDFGTRIGGGRVSVLRVELPTHEAEAVQELEHDLFHLGEVTGVGIKLYDPALGENAPLV